VVMLYHLLWELTHVVFEHPGLLEVPEVPNCDDEMCITCSDEGRVAEVQSVRVPQSAEVLAGGQRESVDVSLLDGVVPGDLVLVHAGVAISAIGDQPEAEP
jgi:hydrogenase maturation factor